MFQKHLSIPYNFDILSFIFNSQKLLIYICIKNVINAKFYGFSYKKISYSCYNLYTQIEFLIHLFSVKLDLSTFIDMFMS